MIAYVSILLAIVLHDKRHKSALAHDPGPQLDKRYSHSKGIQTHHLLTLARAFHGPHEVSRHRWTAAVRSQRPRFVSSAPRALEKCVRSRTPSARGGHRPVELREDSAHVLERELRVAALDPPAEHSLVRARADGSAGRRKNRRQTAVTEVAQPGRAPTSTSASHCTLLISIALCLLFAILVCDVYTEVVYWDVTSNRSIRVIFSQQLDSDKIRDVSVPSDERIPLA